MHRKQKSLRL